ncbi:hypothetical protein BGX28_007400 [Mortierella sp. GBA30]|nr:hypothetical protein BGX28_007400 [Mortierella sp. GBA30]
MAMILLVALLLSVSRTADAFQIQFRDKLVHGVLDVGVGQPATTYSLLIDTGSSNTWVGANKPYMKTMTSQGTANNISVRYGTGSFSGVEVLDKVTLGSIVIDNQSIGVASNSSGLEPLDGILGVGPVVLTNGTLTPDKKTLIPTVTDNLFSQGKILDHSITIGGNIITFGPTTATSVTYVPVTSTKPSKDFWGIDAGMRYGNATLFSLTAGIVDHGTTLITLATDYFKEFQRVSGLNTMDPATGLIRKDDCQNLKPLVLTLGSTALNIPWNYYIWPRANNTAIGGVDGACYIAVGDNGNSSGTGLDFIIGYNTLKHFNTVLDSAGGRRVGIAELSSSLLNLNV